MTTKQRNLKFKCPQCDRMFQRKTGLGSHLRLVHGIAGQSKTTLAYHANKNLNAADTPKGDAAIPAATQTEQHLAAPPQEAAAAASTSIPFKPTGPPFICPECKEDSFTTAAHLGRHRRFAHGILGKYTRAKEAELDAATNPPKRRGRPPGPRSQSTDLQLTERISTPHATKLHTADNGEVHAALDPIAFALTIGSIKEFCRRAAEEHGIPTREFTRQCAELFLREARR